MGTFKSGPFKGQSILKVFGIAVVAIAVLSLVGGWLFF